MRQRSAALLPSVLFHISLYLLLSVFLVTGCATVPAEPPPPPPPPPIVEAPPPPPAPEPEPAVELPRPQAPLDGPRWVLESLYGTARLASPPAGAVWVEFDDSDPEGEFRVFTGIEEVSGTWTSAPRGGLTIRTVRFTDISTQEQRFSTYRRQLLDNIALVKGYYITGETWEASRLTLFGGIGLEEIILAEFAVGEFAAGEFAVGESGTP